jgi:hypothetical protein
MAAALIREGVRKGSGLWFYDCPACPCDFGALTRDRAAAQQQAADHDAEYHPGTPPAGEGDQNA